MSVNILPELGVITALFAVFAALITARNALIADRKMRVLEYVSNQFDRNNVQNARSFIHKVSEKIKSGETTLQEELLEESNYEHLGSIKEYLRSLDRIGSGILVGALDKDLFFKIWQPDWVVSQWKILSSVIAENEEKSGVSGYYAGFEWLTYKALSKMSIEIKKETPIRNGEGIVNVWCGKAIVNDHTYAHLEESPAE